MLSRLINFNLFTPANVIAIGAIIFFWGSMAFFARSVARDKVPTAPEQSNQAMS